jgi:hypothetical protein
LPQPPLLRLDGSESEGLHTRSDPDAS